MEKVKPTDLPQKPRVAVLSYGGTLFMEPSGDGALGAAELGEDYRFEEDFPKVAEFCRPTFHELEAVDSSDMNLGDYARIASVIRELADDYDGVVVTQGTDTLEFSAPALSFALADLQMPVVLTGAQLSRDEPGSDAQNNVTNACWVASLMVKRQGERVPAFPEVVVTFGSKIIRGTRCRKFSERDLDAFDTVNGPLLGRIQLEVSLNEPAIRRESARDFAIDSPVEFDDAVGVVSLYPSMRPKLLLEIGHRCSGIILSTYGAGNIPCSSTRSQNPYSLEEAISRLVEAGTPVGITTRCVVGAAEMGAYENNAAARRAGARVRNDRTTETAYVKLSWVLANEHLWPKEAKRALEGGPGYIGAVRKAMLDPVVGEISVGEEMYQF